MPPVPKHPASPHADATPTAMANIARTMLPVPIGQPNTV
ncbi:hypothetical protein BZL29_8379 [Mycobacterium kansasii]|uniref:Uncharacterized protein n=1 Tax=Mycobacterium kansasii TaxID=1768 RepID=A0A1V3WAQ5_MYCKA|nr:hypothetical protein BZL29_8379 [Mycobacterium kansasii]